MKIQNYLKSLIRWLFYFAGWIVACFLCFLFLSILFPIKINKEYSPIILSKDNVLLNAFLTDDDKWRMYTEINEITPELKKAIVFKEDKYFYYHPGINPVSIVRALVKNTRTGIRTSGASTITMQVARMLDPKERTYANKLKEMFRALELELQYSKAEILQLYLNLVPYGSNIEGVKAASIIYFGKMPDHLSIGEIAALSIIPNRPVSLRIGKNNDTIMVERNKWLRRYEKAGLFDKKYIADALDEPLDGFRRYIPGVAPHFSIRVKNSYPNLNSIHTTLDIEIQRKTEQLVGIYSRRLYFQNIKNAMALIINNKTRSILAYVGSADFSNDEDGGQVDGIRAIRSPGSTLKPLVYAIGFDEGIITPKTVIADVPTSFSGYEPENYDEKFYGNVTVENALARSLNIPAVKILDEIQPKAFIDKLAEAGFQQIKQDRTNLGLSMVLGGCGVNLEELTGLYACIANCGEYAPMRLVLTDSVDINKEQLISKGAAFMVTEIMTQLKRPDLPVNWDVSMHTPKIAWKTGTSYGRRDAWSIGFNKEYTIGVWVGNFSGEGVPELNGADKATPLLFQLFNAIDYDSEKDWFSMSDDLQLRYVCAETGQVPGPLCDNLIIDYYIPGVSGTVECNHIKKAFISADSSISYCTTCLPEAGYITAYYPNLSPELITYYDANNIHYQKIPPHNPKCERLLVGLKPQITSPINDNEYYVNVLDSMEIMLSCHAANDVSKVYWYVNNAYFKTVDAGKNIFFHPVQGKNSISCTDDKGRSSEVQIVVKYTSF
jgi:penicillin-binding protein 1C